MKIEDCPLCSTVPERCVQCDTAISPAETPLPAAVRSFVVVGGPQMDGATAILRCPQCGACYRKVEETESQANGPSWDTTTVTRLDPVSAVAIVAEVEAALEAAQRSYDAVVIAHVAALRAAPHDLRVLDRTSQSLFFGSAHLRFSQSLDVLLDTLLTHAHQEPRCPALYLEWFLAGLAGRDEAKRDEIRTWLRGRDLSACPPEVEWLERAVLPVEASR